jgi:hypothetical protein
MAALLFASPSYGFHPTGARIGPGVHRLKKLAAVPTGPETFPLPATLSSVASVRLSPRAVLALSDNPQFSPARGWARVVVGPWDGPVYALGVDPQTVNFARLVPVSLRGGASVTLEDGRVLAAGAAGASGDLDTVYPDGTASVDVPAGTLAILRAGRTGASSPAVIVTGPKKVTREELGFRIIRVEYCAL